MQSRFHPMFYVVLPLAVLGLATQFNALLEALLIPIILIVVLFGLYVITQKRPLKPRPSRHSSVPRRQPEKLKSKRTSSPFRVIEGRKNREDEPPRYH